MAIEMRLVDHALDFLGRGWSIVPISTGTKKPVGSWKQFQHQRATESMVREWFKDPRVGGIAVIFGAVSGGLASRDFDDAEAYHRWAKDHPELATALPTVKTSRGFHVYFRCRSERYQKHGDGEYRGDSGHYSVLPPSVHPSGARYEWIVRLPSGDLPEIDAVAAGLLSEGVTKQLDDLPVKSVIESAECHFSVGSVVSVDSVISAGSVVSVNSVVSAVSVLSITSYSPAETIRITLPRKQGERNLSILRFARGIKFNCGMKDALKADLKMIVREWHQAALPVIGTPDFDETWSDFLHAFKRARLPLGSLIDLVLQSLDTGNLPAVASRFDSAKTRQLIGLCARLAELHPRRQFFLSCADIASRIPGFIPMSAWRTLRMFEDEGLIENLDPGNEYRAARFRWIGGEVGDDGKQTLIVPEF